MTNTQYTKKLNKTCLSTKPKQSKDSTDALNYAENEI